MNHTHGLRCRHAFEFACVHANGEVVCSIIDGRGDFVLGNVHQQPLGEIFASDRARELRQLVLSTADDYCRAIGKSCPLKSIPVESGEDLNDLTAATPRIRFLAIEPTTACDLRCLACPVRDFTGDVTWRHAWRDGGMSFLIWDGMRRAKQHAADRVRRLLPPLATRTPPQLGRRSASLLRGRIPRSRTGTLPIDVLKRVVTEAGPAVERVDLFNYGEPFLYRHLVDALRHVRQTMPTATIAISTDGMQVREPVEASIVEEGLLDWIIFSIDGSDADSYRRYRIRGDFNVAFANLVRFHRRVRTAGSRMRVIWQYVVFRWNDRDDQFKRAIAMAEEHGLPIWFDFANTWGHSRRSPDDLRYLAPYLKPFTALPGEQRQEGW
jgi:MoaA/NifB/PqqE/SkfB family radical SAM enzyme